MWKQYFSGKRLLVIHLTLIALSLLVGTFLIEKVGLRLRRQPSVNPQSKELRVEGEEATQFLNSNEGAPLTKILNEELFKISHEERSPFDGGAGGYLALSHEQNINAWFTKDGVTIRPTGSEATDNWKFGMKLKAYGYGDQLVQAGDVSEYSVNGIRVEYQRQSKILEWYENRSAGIEQGFTLSERPRSEQETPGQLKIVVSISGDLRPSVNDKNDEIKLVGSDKEPILTYGNLSVFDASSAKLPAHLETNDVKNEIVIVVDDRSATYPIVIDPVTASEQARLFTPVFEGAARFGFSVGIYGNVAMVGAPNIDFDAFTLDTGRVYVFIRTGSTWSFERAFDHPNLHTANLRCGYSVDVSDPWLIYGCPGFQTTKGGAIALFRGAPNNYQEYLLDHAQVRAGDRFGAYVSNDSNNFLVGAPFHDLNQAQDTNDGAVFVFKVDFVNGISSQFIPGPGGPFANNLFGSDVAIENRGDTLVVGEPNADASQPTSIPNRGVVHVFTRNSSGTYTDQVITASDFAAEDQFGFTVAISGNTIAVGSPFDDNQKGINAGSVYVFRRLNSGIWTQETKLVASDGFANDEFSYFGLAISNSTIVVGSHLADGPNFPFDPNENRGEVYIYSTTNGVWIEDSRIRASDGSPGDEFGLGIDLDDASLIVGAPSDDAPSLDTGSAYVYTLSCRTASAPRIAAGFLEPEIMADNIDLCENTRMALTSISAFTNQTYQWRKDGVNIPGATSLDFSKTFTTADSGTYDVVVSTACSSRISPPVVLSVKTGCDVTPSSQNFNSGPGSGAFNVTACPTCYWRAIFENSGPAGFYLQLLANSGRGPGPLNFTFGRNPYDVRTNGVYAIAGKLVSVAQAASPNLIVTATDFSAPRLEDLIFRANQTPGDDVITFDIPGPGPHVINMFQTTSITGNVKIINDRIGDESVMIQGGGSASNFRIFEIGPTGNALIAGLTISNGKTVDQVGTAVGNFGGRVTLRNCSISNNTTNSGAAVSNHGGIVEINNCTFVNNKGATGGALHNRSLNGSGVMLVNNSTFSGNSADSGGGLQNGVTGEPPAFLTLRNCTFSNNTSPTGFSVSNNSFLTTVNSIFRGALSSASIANTGTVISLGHNLTDDNVGGDFATGPGGLLNGPGDIRNTNPNLGPLMNNGGLTLTHALISPSAAINGGDDNVLSAPFSFLTEQRGFLRKAGSSVDIGAFESGSTFGPGVQFSATSYSGGEGAGRIDLILSRTGDSSIPVNVSYATTDKGSGNSCAAVSEYASSRCDYITALGTVRLNAGETSKIISLLLIDDVIPENSEKLTIEITDVKGARIGPQNLAEVTITDNETSNPPSPLSQPIFFVRQHYLDFLNREPDAGGLNFWTNEITSCGANAQCVEVKRINVSAAFFLSIEFQETGYLVYRCYKSSFGNLAGKPVPIRFADFLRDTQEIGKNVVVGSPGWEAQLESNKQAYSIAFVNRPEFIKSFANTLTADQFVTQMNNNAGGVLSPSEKANLVALLGSTPFDTVKRAQVLRAVAEDADLRNAEFNKAFVLMQYFGYMRRNPDDLPDTNFDGFNFWLAKLNQFNGNYINAEMVKAFIQSIEYGRRFAP